MRASLLLALWLGAVPQQEKALEDLILPPFWSHWSEFGVGSSVTLEVEVGDKKARKTTTMKEKTATTMTFEEVVEVNGVRRPAQNRTVSKPKGNPGVYDREGFGDDCPKCKKPRKDHRQPVFTESAEKIRVGDSDVNCRSYENSSFDCEGKLAEYTRNTVADDVPGKLVRSEEKTKTAGHKITCVRFEKK